MKEDSSKRNLIIWRVTTLALLVLCGYMSWIIYSTYSVQEKDPIASGKRFIISVGTGEIRIKEKLPEPPQAAEPAKTEEQVSSHEPEKKPEGEEKISFPEVKPLPPADNAKNEEKKEEGNKEAVTVEQKTEVKPEAKQEPSPAVPDKSKPKIAIIMSGLGLSRTSTTEAMSLPSVITFSFSPYSNNLAEWVSQAKQSGHEILLDFPLEPNDYPITDPGPYALLNSLSKEENLLRFRSLLALVEGYSGLLTAKDEKFTASAVNLAPIISEIKDRDLKLIFSERNPSSPVFALSENINFPFWSSEMIIDRKISREDIENNLAELEKIAFLKGSVICTARPYPITARILKQWMESLPGKGIEVVPISSIPRESRR